MRSNRERLVSIFRVLKALGGRPRIAARQAMIVYATMMRLARGYHIGREYNSARNQDEFFSLPRARQKKKGPAKELRDFYSAARKAAAQKMNAEEWMNVWAAQHPSTWRLCRPALFKDGSRSVDPQKLLGHFSAPGHTIAVPKPEIILPALKAELARLAATPNPKTRKRDPREAEAVAVVGEAYEKMTGEKPNRRFKDAKLSGQFKDLCDEIDHIFGTKLFADSDSRRLRLPAKFRRQTPTDKAGHVK